MSVDIVKVEPYEIEELACKILGLDYDEIDGDTYTIEEEFSSQLGINLESFSKVVSLLLPMIDYGKSPLTGKEYKGFADTETNQWLVKIEI